MEKDICRYLLDVDDTVAPVIRKALRHLGPGKVLEDIVSAKASVGWEMRTDNGEPRTAAGILLKHWKDDPWIKKALFKKQVSYYPGLYQLLDDK